MERQTC